MGVANTVINDKDEYQQILDQHPLVFALFVSEDCPACLEAGPNFKRIADKYTGRAKSMVLDTAQTPRIDGVTGTPTLMVYKNALEVENLKGIGYPDEQEEILEDLFKRYAP